MEQIVNQDERFPARTVKLEREDSSYQNIKLENDDSNYVNTSRDFHQSTRINTSQDFHQSTGVNTKQDFHQLTRERRVCKLSRVTGDPRPFPCVWCEKRFKLLHHLEAHVHTHTGIRPYPCDHCASRFTQLSSMRRHCITIHGIEAVSRVGNKSLTDSWTPNHVDYVEALTISTTLVMPVDRVTCVGCCKKFKSSFSLKRHAPNCRATNFCRVLGGENNPNPPPQDELTMLRMQDVGDEAVWGRQQRPRKKRKLDKPCRSDYYVERIGNELGVGASDEDYDNLEMNGEDLNCFSYKSNILSEDDTKANPDEFDEIDRQLTASEVAYNGDNVKTEIPFNGDDIKTEIADDFDNQSDFRLPSTNHLINNTKVVVLNGDAIKTEIADDFDYHDDSRLSTTNRVFRKTSVVASADVLRVGNNVIRNKERGTDAVRSHICFVCHKGFRLAHHLTNHILTHTGARPYTCFSCNHSFSQVSSLNRHKRTSCRSAPHKRWDIQNNDAPVLDVINGLAGGLF